MPERATDAASWRDELECVPEQVHQDALQLVGIHCRHAVLVRVHHEFDIPIRREDSEVRREETHQRGDVRVGKLDLELVRLELRHVEEIVDVFQQNPGVARNHFS